MEHTSAVDPALREKTIIRTSIVGIAANLLLVVFKALVGLFSNSIAVLLDAVNNLTDALSSIITIIGTRLASRKPDKNHPLGHGRVEYITAMLVSALVIYAGITSGVESVKKIIHPETPSYSVISLVIIGAAFLVKVLLGRYVSAMGKKVNSGALTASGQDALSDAVLSLSVLGSALVFTFTGLSLEPYVGVVIAVFIIKSGFELMSDSLTEIVGKRVDREYLHGIQETLREDPEVLGVYDLILHSYGPDHYIGSVHVEIRDTMTAVDIDRLERRLAEKVYSAHGVILAGIGIYSSGGTDTELRERVIQLLTRQEGVLQVHGFYADPEKRTLSVDVVLDFALPDRAAVFKELCKKVQAEVPDWTVQMTLDLDI